VGIMANNVPSQSEKINIGQSIKENLDLTSLSTMHIKAKAQFGAFPSELPELRALLSWASEQSLPVTILGGGSNCIISDQGIKGLAIIMTGMNRSHINGELFCVRPGLNLESAIDRASEAGLAGLEMLGGIPGTVGGAVFGNAGANNVQISDNLYYVDYLTLDGKLHRMQTHADEFSYRHSPFMEMKDIILYEAAFRLTPTRQTAQLRIIKEGAKQRRKEKHQYDYPSAGCLFRNPPGLFAGKIIEDAGLKGCHIGGAMISPYHANYLINIDGTATGSDARALSELVHDTVRAKTGIELQYEVRFLGSW